MTMSFLVRHVCMAALAALPATACSGGGPTGSNTREARLIAVAAEPSQIGTIRTMVHASGTIVPSEGAEFLVLAPEPARVIDVLKDVGDPVDSGEVVVQFELPFASQDLARYEAELAQLQARVENATLHLERTRGFVERGLVPRQDADTADRELAYARAEQNRAQIAHAAAEAAAARAVVRAPFNGVVVQRFYNPGDLVAVTTNPVLRVVDPARLEVLANVPPVDVSRVLPGAAARVASPATPEPVLLTVVAPPQPAPYGTTRSIPARLSFRAPPDLPVDATVALDIEAEERTDVVFVPAEALIDEGDEISLFVAADDRAERRVVTAGLTDAARVEITSGLEAGELVITRGQLGLWDGAPISVAVSDR